MTEPATKRLSSSCPRESENNLKQNRNTGFALSKSSGKTSAGKPRRENFQKTWESSESTCRTSTSLEGPRSLFYAHEKRKDACTWIKSVKAIAACRNPTRFSAGK